MTRKEIGNMLDLTNKQNLNDNFEQLFEVLDDVLARAKSAYDLWLDQGNSGTLQDFLNSLKGKDAIIEEGSITAAMVDFLTPSVNLFNKKDLVSGKLLSYLTGLETDNANYSTTPFIETKPNIQMTQNKSFVICFYDTNKNFISGLAMLNPYTNSRTFTTPANTAYRKTSIITSEKDTYQLEIGTTSTAYKPWGYTLEDVDIPTDNILVNTSNVVDGSITTSKLSFLEHSANLFDKNKAQRGYYVNQSTGGLGANASYSASAKIPVKPNTTYTKTNTLIYYAFFDSAGNYTATSATSTSTFTTSSTTAFVEITCLTGDLDKTMLVEGNTLPASYVNYGEYVPTAMINTQSLNIGVKPDAWGKFLMRKYKSQYGKTMLPASNERTEIALIGDSWTDYKPRFAEPLRNILKPIFGDGGIGFIGMANNHYGNGAVTVGGFTGTWKQYDAHTDPGLSKGVDTAMLESTTANSVGMINISEDSDYLEVHTLNQTGTWRWNVDGGAWTEVDSSTTNKVTVNMSLGLHKFNFEHLTGTTTFVGAVSYKGTKGAIVHKVGNSGQKASDITATDRTNWVNQFAKLNVHVANIMLGTNDMSANVPLETFKSQIREIVGRIREAKPGIDVTLTSPSGNNLTGKLHTMKEYDQAIYDVAKELNCAYVSFFDNLGDFAVSNANGLMQSDGIHPNEAGGQVIANTYYDKLLRV